MVQHLFEIQSAVHGYLGPETQQELVRKMYVLNPVPFPFTQCTPYNFYKSKLTNNINNSKNLTLALSTLSTHTKPPSESQSHSPAPQTSSSSPTDTPLQTIQLPPEIIDYVDAARNPDIYTREFVELVQRGNQDLKGKAEAFAGFRDLLGREMENAMPECKGEVGRVLRATGGRRDGEGEGGEGAGAGDGDGGATTG